MWTKRNNIYINWFYTSFTSVITTKMTFADLYNSVRIWWEREKANTFRKKQGTWDLSRKFNISQLCDSICLLLNIQFCCLQAISAVQVGNAKPCNKVSPFPLGDVHSESASECVFIPLLTMSRPGVAAAEAVQVVFPWSLSPKTEDRLWSNPVTSKFTSYLFNFLYELPSYF